MKNKNYKVLKILITFMVLLLESGSFSLGNSAFFIRELLTRKEQVCEEAKIEIDSIIAQVRAQMQANNKEGYKAVRRDALARMDTILQCQKETFKTYVPPPPPIVTNSFSETIPNPISQENILLSSDSSSPVPTESSNTIEPLKSPQNTNADSLLLLESKHEALTKNEDITEQLKVVNIENRDNKIEPIVELANGEKINTSTIINIGDLSKALKFIETSEPVKLLQLIAKINILYRLAYNSTNPISENAKNAFTSRQDLFIKALTNRDTETIKTITSLLQLTKDKREIGQPDVSIEKFLQSESLMDVYKSARGNESLDEAIELYNKD